MHPSRALQSGLILLLAAQPAAAQLQGTASADRARREIVIEVGPVDLPADGAGGMPQAEPTEFRIPIDGWFRGFALELIDADGAPVPRQVIHHVNLMLPERRELFTPVMMRLAAAGRETRDVRLPWFLGIPVSREDRLLMTAMLHNPTAKAYRGVRVRARLAYRERGEARSR